MSEERGEGENLPGRLLVPLLVGAVFLGAVAAVVAWEAGRLPTKLEVEDPVRYVEALKHAPWLAARYGTRGIEAEANGDLEVALYNYGLVLQALPEHAGTRLARARAVAHGPARDQAAAAQALEDVVAAERGYRQQLQLLVPPGASPGSAPETQGALRELERLRQMVQVSDPK